MGRIFGSTGPRAVTGGRVAHVDPAEPNGDKASGEPEPQPQKRIRPCYRRKVSKKVEYCSSVFHFCTPFVVSYWVIRFVAAGTMDPLTIVLLSLCLTVTILSCVGAGCCRKSARRAATSARASLRPRRTRGNKVMTPR